MSFLSICSFMFLVMLGCPAIAEDVKPMKSEVKTPVTKLDAATDAMMKGLDDNQLKQFAAIENSNGTIRAIEDVQMSISRAVESCSKSNPDIKEDISAKFEAWKNNLRPVMKQARTKLDKMILLQGFAQPSQVRSYLKTFDEAVVFRNQGIKAVPVTSKEDCEKLQSSMVKTQNDLVNLLTESLALNSDLKVKE